MCSTRHVTDDPQRRQIMPPITRLQGEQSNFESARLREDWGRVISKAIQPERESATI